MSHDPQGLSTRLVHAGAPPPVEGAVVLPVFQTANYVMDGADRYEDVRYQRLSNSPNHLALQARMAAIEGAEDALVFGSGMAAIATTLLGLLGAGDHVIAQRTLYGGTHTLLQNDLARLGVTTTFVDPVDPAAWKAALRPETRVIYVEAISNPLVEVAELEAAVALARAHGLVSVIDATFASPVNYRPVAHGFDLVVHSATKYLNGHSDVIAGVVAGRRDLLARIGRARAHLGGTLDAHACALLERGMKTLALRVERQNRSALALATWLAAHPRVGTVHYPGLPDDPNHARAARWFDGFGGMLSFTVEDAPAFLERLRLIIHAASLGGVETLAVQPARSSHLGMDPAEREALGITDGLVRLSVGIEDVEDLVIDLERALEP